MPSQVSWIMTGYMVVYAIGSVVFGKLADQYRLKDLLTYGLLIFAVGSIVGMIATEYWMIVLGRILQASGASVLPATAMIIPIRYFAPKQRGRALGLVLFPAAIASALMGRKGGLLADEHGNFFVVSLAAFFMLVCFSLLSTFVGTSPIAVAVILIVGVWMLYRLQFHASKTLVHKDESFK